MTHSFKTLSALALAIAWGCCAGCSVTIDGGSGPTAAADDVQVEFPESGDELIVVTDTAGNEMTVSGDRGTNAVSRILLARPGGALDAEFGDEGHLARVVLDDDATFDFTQNADGTFDYTLTENDAVVSLAGGLSPAEDDSDVFGPAAKVSVRTKFSTVDSLACTVEAIGNVAQRNCRAAGVSDPPQDSTLSKAMQADRRAVNAGLLGCHSVVAREAMKDASDACEEEATERFCIAVISVVEERLTAAIRLSAAILKDVAAEMLSAGDTAELCSAAPDASNGDGPSGPDEGDTECRDADCPAGEVCSAAGECVLTGEACVPGDGACDAGFITGCDVDPDCDLCGRQGTCIRTGCATPDPDCDEIEPRSPVCSTMTCRCWTTRRSRTAFSSSC